MFITSSKTKCTAATSYIQNGPKENDKQFISSVYPYITNIMLKYPISCISQKVSNFEVNPCCLQNHSALTVGRVGLG